MRQYSCSLRLHRRICLWTSACAWGPAPVFLTNSCFLSSTRLPASATRASSLSAHSAGRHTEWKYSRERYREQEKGQNLNMSCTELKSSLTTEFLNDPVPKEWCFYWSKFNLYVVAQMYYTHFHTFHHTQWYFLNITLTNRVMPGSRLCQHMEQRGVVGKGSHIQGD